MRYRLYCKAAFHGALEKFIALWHMARWRKTLRVGVERGWKSRGKSCSAVSKCDLRRLKASLSKLQKIPSVNWAPLDTPLHILHFPRRSLINRRMQAFQVAHDVFYLNLLKLLFSEFMAFTCFAKLFSESLINAFALQEFRWLSESAILRYPPPTAWTIIDDVFNPHKTIFFLTNRKLKDTCYSWTCWTSLRRVKIKDWIALSQLAPVGSNPKMLTRCKRSFKMVIKFCSTLTTFLCCCVETFKKKDFSQDPLFEKSPKCLFASLSLEVFDCKKESILRTILAIIP